MQSAVRKQLLENEYKMFGTLFRCSDTEALASKLVDVLKASLPKRNHDKAKETAQEISSAFLDHFNEIEIHIDFYESHEAEAYERAKEINNERIRSENDFDKKLKYFEQIKERCDRYKKK